MASFVGVHPSQRALPANYLVVGPDRAEQDSSRGPAWTGRREQEASFFTVVVWRDQAEHAVESLAKGGRVVVVGRLQQRAWTAEDGSARSLTEVVAEELGPACGGRRRPRPGR